MITRLENLKPEAQAAAARALHSLTEKERR
jgi:hypothetical protein